MKVGFICPNLPGHINPMTALARHLQARNHEVVFLYLSSANGLPCVPGDKHDDMNANRPEISQLEGFDALAFYCSLAAKETEMIFKFVTNNARDNRGPGPHTRSYRILCSISGDEIAYTLRRCVNRALYRLLGSHSARYLRLAS